MNIWEKHAEDLRHRRRVAAFERWIRRHPFKTWSLLLGFSILVGEVAMLLRWLLTGSL